MNNTTVPDGSSGSPGSPLVEPDELSMFGKYSMFRFEMRGNPNDLENAISSFAKALSLTPLDDPTRTLRLIDLGYSYFRRSTSSNEVCDLERAIEYYAQVDLHSLQDRDRKASTLSNFGACYLTRFERLGDLSDLDNAIRHINMAISAKSASFMRSESLYLNLASSHVRRFERSGDIDDIHEAIQYYKQALHNPAQNDLEAQSRCLNHLGAAYRARFERLGGAEDINMAINYQTQAVRLASEMVPSKAEWLASLGTSLRQRFQYFGNLDDIDRAIGCQQHSVSLTATGAAGRPLHLAALGASYKARFEHTGQLKDLDAAINAQAEAIAGTSDNDIHRPPMHNGLAQSYDYRFRRLGDLEDIDKAIHHHSLAANLTPEDHINKFWYLTYLGNSMKRRFRTLQNLSDIDAAIQNQEHAISLVPSKHAAKVDCFENLGNSYGCRFNLLKNLKDIDQAITCHSYAVLFTGEEDSKVAQRLSNLSMSYTSRFNYSGDREDIDMSIHCQAEAVALTPQDHIRRPTSLGRLAELYWSVYRHFGGLDSIDKSLRHFKQAALRSIGDPKHQFQAARSWATLAASHSQFDPLPAYTRAMELVPQVAWLGAEVEQRYERIVSMGAISVEAAAVACSMGEHDLALEWMEAGRSIVWRQMLQLRTPFDDVAAVNPVLAEKMKQASLDLNEMGIRSTDLSDVDLDGPSAEQASQRHRRLVDEWEELLAEAKQIPEFKDFLVPKRAAELRLAARNGLVVAINVHTSRSDALILSPGSSVIELVRLPDLLFQDTSDARSQLSEVISGTREHPRGERRPVWAEHENDHTSGSQFKHILATLWKEVVCPVLNHLGYMRRPLTPKLPHITWCTAGPLALLPLHAAGIYDGPSPVKAFDYVISSYIPTLGDLLSASLPDNFLPDRGTSGVLAVAQPHTKGCAPLPGTLAEVAHVQKFAAGLGYTQLQDDHATTTSVLDAMERHNWIHLACHATQDSTRPIASGFHLHDGVLNLSSIVQKSLKNKGLAFLSACQTATGDEKVPGEAVHLAAGMLVAGYKSVIATLWSIKDEDAPLVAERVYARLLRDGTMRSGEVAEALHGAVGALRDVVGDEAFDRWVPYVHLGA
ncbi:hypothetical protein FRC10_005477 [Ceratobasidium sp. 414]|nr:hypothetical protein FRC10_005477 [Ceratobasidium sp. 414]